MIAEFLSTFAADLEPPDTGAEPLPAEAAECAPAAPANGDEPVGTTVAEAAGVVPERVADAFVLGAVAEGVVPLTVSTVVCAVCPSAMPDTDAAAGACGEVGGAVTVAMGGRLVNVR